MQNSGFQIDGLKEATKLNSTIVTHCKIEFNLNKRMLLTNAKTSIIGITTRFPWARAFLGSDRETHVPESVQTFQAACFQLQLLPTLPRRILVATWDYNAVHRGKEGAQVPASSLPSERSQP